MIRRYCTLFDQSYAAKGLALYESLVRHSSEPCDLTVLAMDDATAGMLREWHLPHLDVLPLPVLERVMGLGTIRSNRTWQEYCWTCASQLMEYLLPVADMMYLDADLFFFEDPKVIFDELGDRSIGITPHRLVPAKKQHLEVNGQFNVGVVAMKNTATGQRCAARWAAQCRERCSAEVGCGDQVYLNEWPDLYGSECVALENIGVNVGPWSLANWTVTEGPRLDGHPVNCYHFHEFQDESLLTHHALRPADIEWIYRPYIEAWERARVRLALHRIKTIVADR